MKNHNSMIHFIREAAKPFRLLIAGQCIVGIIWALYVSFRPYMFKIILDRISTISPELAISHLTGPVALYAVSGLCIVIIMRIYDYIWLKLNPPLKRHVGTLLMQKMMHHSLILFQNNFAGNLANKIKDVMSGIPDLFKISINQFFCQFLSITIAIITVSTISSTFSLLLTIWVAVFIIGILIFCKQAKTLCRASSQIRSNVVGTLVDMLSNISSIHLFSAQKTESARLKTDLDVWVTADQKRDWYFLAINAFQGLTFIAYQTVCFIFLILGFKKGVVTSGDFALIITINATIINNLWTLSADILTFADTLGNVSQGLDIALAPVNIIDKPDATTLQITKGRIVFDQVTFHYKKNEHLFKKLSITIEPGQKVGLVGYSGSGKSTFVNLILRLYDVIDGQILIDDQNICNVTQESLHDAIGMIPQDPSLFNRSLLENIRYGDAHATDAEIIEAAKKAHAHEFITELPQSYDHMVGERGSKLSGGQRQRIAIARAMLKNAPLLILDEATSQLDTITERKIQESLWELMQNKTTLVVAHRLSTLLHMDRILVFNQGRIVEDGTHYDLLALNGIYKTLWDAQVDGLLPHTQTNHTHATDSNFIH